MDIMQMLTLAFIMQYALPTVSQASMFRCTVLQYTSAQGSMSLSLLQGRLPTPSHPSPFSQGIQFTCPTLPTFPERGDLSAVYTSSIPYNPMFGDELLASAAPHGSPPRNPGQSHNPFACAHASSNQFHASASDLHHVNLPSEPTPAQKAQQQNRPLVPHNALDSAHASQGNCSINRCSQMLVPTFSKHHPCHPPPPFPSLFPPIPPPHPHVFLQSVSTCCRSITCFLGTCLLAQCEAHMLKLTVCKG